MKCEQIKLFIEDHKRMPLGYCFSITISNRLTYYGFLEKFEDHEHLINQNKIRFVSIDQYERYYWDLHYSGKQSIGYSVILDLTEISEIELIRQDRSNRLGSSGAIGTQAEEILNKRKKTGN